MTTVELSSLHRLLKQLVSDKEFINETYDRGLFVTHKVTNSATGVLLTLEKIIYGEDE
jgi:hypothetical protein